MDAPCQACSSGPFGFAGHADLNVQSLGDACISLRCGRCDSFWSRTLAREGYFAWAALTERMASSRQMGLAVPPRSTDTALRPLPWRGGDSVRWRTDAT